MQNLHSWKTKIKKLKNIEKIKKTSYVVFPNLLNTCCYKVSNEYVESPIGIPNEIFFGSEEGVVAIRVIVHINRMQHIASSHLKKALGTFCSVNLSFDIFFVMIWQKSQDQFLILEIIFFKKKENGYRSHYFLFINIKSIANFIFHAKQ